MIALWLGLYLVTRSPRRAETWLSALALWSLGGYFLDELLALYPPPAPPQEIWRWLYHVALFWPRDVFQLGWKGWLLGWLPSYSLLFWLHATLCMLPGGANFRRHLIAGAGYLVVLGSIIVKIQNRAVWLGLAKDPLYSSAPTTPFFLLFAFGFVTFSGLIMANLTRTARASPALLPRRQLRLFILATLLGGSTGVLGYFSNMLAISTPQVVAACFSLAALLLSGASVARYNALLDRRPLQRDFLHSGAGAGAVLLAYLFLHSMVTRLYELPTISYVFVGCLAVISHHLIDVARLRIDRLVFQHKNRRLSLRLLDLYALVEQRGSDEVMGMALKMITEGAGASWSILLQLTPQGMKPRAAWNWTGSLPTGEIALDLNGKGSEELIVLESRRLPPPVDQAVLLLLLDPWEPVGVLLVGEAISQAGYSEADLDLLRNTGDYLAGLLRDVKIEAGGVPSDVQFRGEISPRFVELALRNLHNHEYLADSPLTKLRLVENCHGNPPEQSNTHLDRGKTLSMILEDAVDKLRPCPGEPPHTPPRDWYPYLILRSAYLDGAPNREIMSRLFISEGTFNRTRRTAIQSITRLLNEMEARFE